MANDLTLGLSTGQVAELADATAIHEQLVGLLFSVPTGILKVWDTILSEEVASHPNPRTDSLLMFPLTPCS